MLILEIHWTESIQEAWVELHQGVALVSDHQDIHHYLLVPRQYKAGREQLLDIIQEKPVL